MSAMGTESGPWTEPTLIQTAHVNTAVIRRDSVTMADLQSVFDTAFAAVVDALGQVGRAPAGPAFASYEGDPAATMNIEVGFPIDEMLDEPVHVGDDVVIGSHLPGGTVAVYSHLGVYDGLGAAWGKLMSWVSAEGHELADRPFWESYVTMPTPEASPESMRTDLFISLSD